MFCIDLVVDDFYGLFGCEYVKKVYFDDVFCIVRVGCVFNGGEWLVFEFNGKIINEFFEVGFCEFCIYWCIYNKVV